jgi:uncharacterized protein YybS (DUF2232 family)
LTLIVDGQVHRDVIIGILVTTLIVFVALSVTMLGPIVCLFLPLPILFYRLKLGRFSALFILGAVSLIVTALVGWQAVGVTAFLFEVGLVGLVLPELLEMNLTIEKTVGFTAGVILFLGAALLVLYSMMSATTPWTLVSDNVNKSAALVLEVYRELDPSEENIRTLTASMDEITYLLLRVMPGLVICGTLFLVWINLLLSRPLLRSKQLLSPAFARLDEWRAPERLVWVVVGSLFLLLAGSGGLKLAAINGLIVMMMIYFFQGIAVVSFYFKKKQFPKALRAILYGLMAMQQLLLLVVVAMGFFDMWFDFRRLRKVEG